MKYHNITKEDMVNGDGLRVVLWVSGCEHKCKGCHNQITWDKNCGLDFNECTKEEIFKELRKDYIQDLEVIKYIDVLVDGKFVQSLASKSYKWAGSTNQRIVDVKKSLRENKIISKGE